MDAPLFKRPGDGRLPQTDHFWLDDFQSGDFQSGKKQLKYRLYEPDGDTDRYPLVLWLHGFYGRGDHNVNQIYVGFNEFGPAFFSNPERQTEFPSYVLAPQCPGGKLWVKFRNNSSTRYLRWVIDLIDELQTKHPIDPSRIYVAGQSMGGFATWALLAEYPDRFAGAIPICGGAPYRKLKRKMDTPVWAFHGDKDRLVRPWRTRRAVKVSEGRNVEVKYTQYPEGSHFIGPQVFQEPELDSWLFSHSR